MQMKTQDIVFYLVFFSVYGILYKVVQKKYMNFAKNLYIY